MKHFYNKEDNFFDSILMKKQLFNNNVLTDDIYELPKDFFKSTYIFGLDNIFLDYLFKNYLNYDLKVNSDQMDYILEHSDITKEISLKTLLEQVVVLNHQEQTNIIISEKSFDKIYISNINNIKTINSNYINFVDNLLMCDINKHKTFSISPYWNGVIDLLLKYHSPDDYSAFALLLKIINYKEYLTVNNNHFEKMLSNNSFDKLINYSFSIMSGNVNISIDDFYTSLLNLLNEKNTNIFLNKINSSLLKEEFKKIRIINSKLEKIHFSNNFNPSNLNDGSLFKI